MNPKQNRLVVLALLLSAATIVTWRLMRSEAPTPGCVQRIEPQSASPTRDTRPTIKTATVVTKTAALAVRWNQPERTIEFFNDPELAPSWVIQSGQEFWRSPATADRRENPAGADNPHFKHAELDRMSHVLVQNPVTGVAEIDVGNYYARADRDGLKFSPSRVAAM